MHPSWPEPRPALRILQVDLGSSLLYKRDLIFGKNPSRESCVKNFIQAARWDKTEAWGFIQSLFHPLVE